MVAYQRTPNPPDSSPVNAAKTRCALAAGRAMMRRPSRRTRPPARRHRTVRRSSRRRLPDECRGDRVRSDDDDSDRSNRSDRAQTQDVHPLTRRSGGTVSRSAPVSSAVPVRTRSCPPPIGPSRGVFTSVRRWKYAASRPLRAASRKRAAMKRAAFASPAVRDALPSMESSEPATMISFAPRSRRTALWRALAETLASNDQGRQTGHERKRRSWRTGKKCVRRSTARFPEIIERVAFGSGRAASRNTSYSAGSRR